MLFSIIYNTDTANSTLLFFSISKGLKTNYSVSFNLSLNFLKKSKNATNKIEKIKTAIVDMLTIIQRTGFAFFSEGNAAVNSCIFYTAFCFIF